MVHGRASVRHAAGPGAGRPRGRAVPRCWRSTCRARGRSGPLARARNFVFLAPPSWEELVRRLVGRGTETPEQREQRLDTARAELAAQVRVRPRRGEWRSRPSGRGLGSLGTSVALQILVRVPIRARDCSSQPKASLCQDITRPPRALPTRRSTSCSRKSDSKYKLVLFAAKRARQINAYYSQLGEGLLDHVGPLVETTVQEKPLSIALREVNAGKLDLHRRRSGRADRRHGERRGGLHRTGLSQR